MQLKIKELCEKRGIKSAYELAKKAKLKMPTAYRAYANDIKQFTVETLGALCSALDCSPNDIFGFESVQKSTVQSPQMPVQSATITPKVKKAKKVVTASDSTIQGKQNASDNELKKLISPDELPELDEKTDMWCSPKQVIEIGKFKNGSSVRYHYDKEINPLPFEPTTKGNYVKLSDLTAYLKTVKRK